MDSLLSTGTVIISPPQPTSGATASTFSTSTATNISSLNDFDISRELDNFFMNLVSAFDIFAQVINLVYLTPPLNENAVTFYVISDEMDSRFPNETMTQYLTFLKTEQWYKDLKGFRKCTTHRKAIVFSIDTTRRFMEVSCETKIILPDNPFSNQPTYSLNRKMHTFGVDIFKKSLNAIDNMYDIMEARIRVADRIPI